MAAQENVISRRALLGIFGAGVVGAAVDIYSIPRYLEAEHIATIATENKMPTAPTEDAIQAANDEVGWTKDQIKLSIDDPGGLETVAKLATSEDVFRANQVIDAGNKKHDYHHSIAQEHGSDLYGALAGIGITAAFPTVALGMEAIVSRFTPSRPIPAESSPS